MDIRADRTEEKDDKKKKRKQESCSVSSSNVVLLVRVLLLAICKELINTITLSILIQLFVHHRTTHVPLIHKCMWSEDCPKCLSAECVVLTTKKFRE